MADVPGKPTAQSFSAGVATEKGLSPLQWSDKCFLCGSPIGETDPRGFYQGTNAMMLCHRGCLNIMATHGGQPQDYHRAMAQPEQAPESPWAVTVPDVQTGPSWLEFADMTALVSYVRSRGDIPERVKVTVAGKIIQAGDGS